MTSWLRSLWTGRTGGEDDDDDDEKKPPRAGGGFGRAPPPPTTQDAQQKLKLAMSSVNKRVMSLQGAVDKTDAQIRQLMGQGRKKEAARLVPTLRRDQRRLEQERGKLNNLREQMGMTDGVKTAREVAEAYKVSTEASRAQLGQFDRDEIDRVMADSRELKEDMEEINDLLGEGMASGSAQARLDELEAEEYLEQMMREDEDLLAGYEEPVRQPMAPRVEPEPQRQPARRLVGEQN